MDRLRKLYENYISELLSEYIKKLEILPEWKLNTYLLSYSSKSKIEKIELIREKYLSNDFVYSILIEDLNLLKNKNFELTSLKILSIDDRFLEANGYLEKKKERVYSFISEGQKLIEEV